MNMSICLYPTLLLFLFVLAREFGVLVIYNRLVSIRLSEAHSGITSRCEVYDKAVCELGKYRREEQESCN